MQVTFASVGLAQLMLLSAPSMDVAAIAKTAFTSEDRVRDVIRNFNADGFGALYLRYKAALHRVRYSAGPGHTGLGKRDDIVRS